MSAAIVRPEREAWLAERRNGIGASEVAAILGVDPRRGALAIYAAKVGDVEAEERKWMRWGRLVEGAICEGYAEETGRPAEDLGAFEIQRHPDAPFLFATLDRVTRGSEATPAPIDSSAMVPLEAKAVAGFKARDWADDPPLHFVVQCQAQMACTGAQWSSLVALIGGLAIAWKDMLRDDAFLAAALPKLEAFWLRVRRREPPEADGLPGTTDALKALYGHEDGFTQHLDDDAMFIVGEWEKAKEIAAAGDAQVTEAANKLRARLGPASFGALPDGSLLTLREVKRGAYQVKETSYRVLRRIRPRLRMR